MMGEANIKLNKTKLKYKWGYSSPYKNYIKIFGSKGTLSAKFIFSKKIFQTGNISIAFKKKRKKIKIKRSNQINNAFNFYLNRIKSKNYNKKSIMLLNLLTQIKKKSKKIFI